MIKNFNTSTEFRKELESHLRSHSIKTGETIERLRRKVAFDRFLARILQASSSFFLKGGYAMELRSNRARATRDIDLTYHKRKTDNKEPISELLFQELLTFSRIDLMDHFVFRIGQPQSDIENAPYGGSRHSVAALIANRPFVEFHLDVGVDFLIDSVEQIQGRNWLEFCGIKAPMIPMISMEQQFAEKIHVYTLPRPQNQINTRTKDLIDLLLLLRSKNQQLDTFKNSLHRIFKARNSHQLPKCLPTPPKSWSKPFSIMAVECGISESLQQSFEIVSDFYNRLILTEASLLRDRG